MDARPVFPFAAPLLAVLVACGGDDSTIDPEDGGTPDGNSVQDAGISGDGSVQDAGVFGDGSVQDAATPDGGPGDAGPVDAGPPPPSPAVSYIGRWKITGGEAIAGYPAARAIARFQGTGASVTLRDAAIAGSGPSYVDVLVDGAFAKTVSVAAGATTVVPLAANLPAGPHEVEIYRRTEAYTGTLAVGGWTFPNGALLAPPARKARHIEFIGNSTLDGYGVDGNRTQPATCSPIAKAHNARRSLIPLLADLLDAEAYAPSASGIGVLYNENPNVGEHIATTYPRTHPLVAGAWDFSSWQPDAIVIMVGGTDLANPAVNPPPTQAAFANGYGQFLAQVRAANPTAKIFATTSPTLNDDYPANYQARTKSIGALASAVAARNSAGDGQVFAFAFTQDGDLTACDYHPSFALYQRMAAEIAPFIRSKTGW